MPKFKVGDIVRVVEVDEDDIFYKIQVGDTFKVVEDDIQPYCLPINSYGYELECGNERFSFREDQLELVVDPKQQEINELHILLSVQDKEIVRLKEIIENQKQAILKLAE